MDRYDLVRVAIIKRAVLDYKNALRKRKYSRAAECERFFLSPWGQFLSGWSGEYIVERCRKEVEKRRRS